MRSAEAREWVRGTQGRGGSATALPRPPGSTLSPACPLDLGEGRGQLGALVARALLTALAGVALVDLGAAPAGGTEACWGRVGRLAERGVLHGYCGGRDTSEALVGVQCWGGWEG